MGKNENEICPDNTEMIKQKIFDRGKKVVDA